MTADELHALLLESVQRHLVADVPVGIFLSAGIDSNAIAALAAELGKPMHTVTVAFDEYAGTRNDEAPLAEAAAKTYCSEHVTVRLGRDQFETLVDEFLQRMDQPTIDGLNTYLASRAATHQGLKVALSGLGGDELFGSYPSFHQIPRLLKWGQLLRLPTSWGTVVQGLAKLLAVPGIPPKAAGLLSGSRDIGAAYLLRRALHLESELDLLLDESWLTEGLERLATSSSLSDIVKPLITAGTSAYAQIAALESCWYMRNQLLRDTDWASMAHGVEVRVPFVDVGPRPPRTGSCIFVSAYQTGPSALRTTIAAGNADAAENRLHYTRGEMDCRA